MLPPIMMDGCGVGNSLLEETLILQEEYIIKNKYLVFVLGSRHTVLKSLKSHWSSKSVPTLDPLGVCVC